MAWVRAVAATDAVAQGEASGLEALAGRAVEESDRLRLRDVEPVNSPAKRPLYEKRKKVYPKLILGYWRRVKWVVMIATLAVYYLAPWIRWDRGPGAPDQAILIDFPSRKFYFFFIEIWPQEFYFLTGLLVLAALSLFLITSVAGRVWCGYTCPQTVWTDLFIHIERWIEGDRNKRIRLDRAPLSVNKAVRKVAKHAAWLLVAVATGGAWVFYFGNAPDLIVDLFDGSAPSAAYSSIAIFTFTTYSLGGIMREQVCTYMCPWPRIQGAMLDQNTLWVSYRADRGEPRGPHKRGESWDGRGDCIDCNQCVAVCPTGIDIRDGAQLECIQCALCIDACNSIMAKVGRPPNLIAYEAVGDAELRAQGKAPTVRLLRPRTILYAGLIAAVGLAMLTALIGRPSLELTVLRDRAPLFVTLSDGSIRNGYQLKLVNRAHADERFEIALRGLPGAVVREPLSGQQDRIQIDVPADSLASVRLLVTLPADQLQSALRDGSARLSFRVATADATTVKLESTTFRGPVR